MARSSPRHAPRRSGGANPRSSAAPSAASPYAAPTRQAGPPRRWAVAEGRQILFGLHAVAAALRNPRRDCLRLWQAGEETAIAAALRDARRSGLERPAPEKTDRHQLEKMTQGAVHQGVVLECAALPETSLEEILAQSPRLLLVLDQVTDPHNVGAVLRSAACFGAAAVIGTDRHAPQATGTLAKAASGALELVPLVRVTNLAQALGQMNQAGLWTVGLAESGTSAMTASDLSGRIAIVLGAEGDGLRRLTMERCDELVRLPVRGPLQTLNVSAAAAIALYEVARQQSGKE